MLPGKTLKPEDFVRILARRRWLLLLPFAGGLALSPLIGEWMPELYRSETVISVVPQRVPDTYVKSTITSTVEDRLGTISDQILSRSQLERTIVDLGLYEEERARGLMEDVVERMRDDVDVRLEGNDSLRVSYVSLDPDTAQQVAERLASQYIEENRRERGTASEGTSLFLDSQLASAKQRLIEQERRLEAYRRQHAGELPSQLLTNLQAIQNAQMQLQAVSESINRARERRLVVQRQIADLQLVPFALPPGNADEKDVSAMPIALQLEAARTQLEQLRMRYTPDHPDVRNQERLIRDLEGRAEQEARRPRNVERRRSPEELAREKRLKDLEEDLKIIDGQIADFARDEGRLKGVIADYQGNVDVVPTRESELINLTRDYDTLKATYDGLLSKREESQLAANLEQRQIGEQFKILDAAVRPERPFNTRRRLGAMSFAAVAGLALGVLIVGVREYRDSSFKHEDDVVRALTIPVLALVPAVVSDQERRSTRRWSLALDVTGTAVMIASVAVFVLWQIRP